MINCCIILAGGRGTRMAKYTHDRPKALIDVSGRPFLFYQLEKLKREGVLYTVISSGYRSEMIEDYVAESKTDMKVDVVPDGAAPLGTGGAIKKCVEELQEIPENFFVLYGDSFLPISYRDLGENFERHNDKFRALMTVYQNEDLLDKSNCEFVDDLQVSYNKKHPTPSMKYIDYGISILSRDVVKQYLPSNENIDLADVYTEMSQKGEIMGHEVSQRFYEIGSESGLQEFTQWSQKNLSY